MRMKIKELKIALAIVLAGVIALSAVLGFKAKNQTVPVKAPAGVSQSETSPGRFDDTDIPALCANLTKLSGQNVTEEMLADLDESIIKDLEFRVSVNNFTSADWHTVTGMTYNALADKYGSKKSRDMGNNGKDYFELGFTGDINFTSSGYVMSHAYDMPNSVMDCIDEDYVKEMKAVDIMLVNNEFPYSDRGSPTPNKTYTFRAEPDMVRYMTEMGVDIVSLANNHTFDYGYDSFIDTVSTLNDEGIPFVGAGMNAAEAAEPTTFIINGYKVGYLASSGVEDPIYTPVATETEAGIMGTYDGGEAMIKAIKAAKQECDYVIVYPHWGYENTTNLSDAQNTLGKAFIDAGADAVVGNHSHCLQGIEFYKNVPIIYSLGNFWFNTRSVPTAMLKLKISEKGMETSLLPGIQAGSETKLYDDFEDKRELFDKIVSWSDEKVVIDTNGIVTPKE